MALSTIKVSKPYGKGHSKVEDYKFELLTNDAYADLMSSYTPFHYSDDGAHVKYRNHKLTLCIPAMLKAYNKTLNDVWDITELIFIPHDKKEHKPNSNPPSIPRPTRVTIKTQTRKETVNVVQSAIEALKSDPTYVLNLAKRDPDFMTALMNGIDAIIAEKEQIETTPEPESEYTKTDQVSESKANEVESVLNDIGATGKTISLADLQKMLTAQQKGGKK